MYLTDIQEAILSKLISDKLMFGEDFNLLGGEQIEDRFGLKPTFIQFHQLFLADVAFPAPLDYPTSHNLYSSKLRQFSSFLLTDISKHRLSRSLESRECSSSTLSWVFI